MPLRADPLASFTRIRPPRNTNRPRAVIFDGWLYQIDADICLSELVADLQLQKRFWEMRVTPPPELGDPAFKALDEDTLPSKLLDLGIVPGSTVHFRRRVKSSPPA